MKTMAGTTSESLEVLQPKEAAKNNSVYTATLWRRHIPCRSSK
jgi:hypothetical protein